VWRVETNLVRRVPGVLGQLAQQCGFARAWLAQDEDVRRLALAHHVRDGEWLVAFET